MSRYLETALGLGRELAAERGAGEGMWRGDLLVPDGRGDHKVERGDAGADLYGGAAGIGLVLAALARFDHGLADGARAGLGRALAEAEAMVEGGQLSLYGGATGVAVAAMQAAGALGDEALGRAGQDLAGRIAEMAAPTDEVDLIGGSAGIIIGLLATHGEAGAIGRLANGLVARSREGWWGRSVANPSGVALCGLGHGASGIGWALIEAGARLGDRSIADAGYAVLDYEDGWFEAETGTWPDLRGREEEPTTPPAT